jgi:tripartite-type tricarboxylate transporter receptor subunit TctC
MTGTDIVHVPFKGSGQILPSLVAGEIQINFGPIIPALPHIRSGRVKALAVTSAKRTLAAPDIPTIAESGVPGYEIDSWYGVAAPAGLPRPLAAKLGAELAAIVNLAEVRERLVREGADPVGSTPAAFAAHIRAERVKWARLVKAARIKTE